MADAQDEQSRVASPKQVGRPRRSEQALLEAAAAAVYRHQVEACADAGPQMLAESATPEAALRAWVALFVEFLVTKHGLAGALQGDSAGSDALHIYFVDRLVPVCDSLLAAALESVGTASRVDAYNVLKGIGNLCIGAGSDDRYKAEVLVQLFISGVLAREVR